MYFSSVEFTDFAPFAKGSRIEFASVPDKPEDLAEVHLLTGENGTGKSRLLCLLAAALGDAKALQARCRREDSLRFHIGLRNLGGQDIRMVLHLNREGFGANGNRSQSILGLANLTPAFARSGVSFLADADLSKQIPEKAWLEGRLDFKPNAVHVESVLKKLHKLTVSAKLEESDRVVRLVSRLEQTLSDVLGRRLSFFPRNEPEEMLCVKLDGGSALSMNQTPDGLRSLIGWLVEAALVMDALAADKRYLREISFKQPIYPEDADIEELRAAVQSGKKLQNGLDIWHLVQETIGRRFPMQSGYAAEARFRSIEDGKFFLEVHESKSAAAASLLRPRVKAGVEEILREVTGIDLKLVVLPTATQEQAAGESSEDGWRTIRLDDEFQIPGVILLDEIETHLHPGWQRQVLPAFQRMFPKAQIFVATHSPFVISSVNYGRVHILRRGEDGVRVETHEAAKGDSYMTAVQEVLGLTGWFDAAVEKELGDFELLLDKAYTSNGAGEAEMRSRAAHFLKPENRYSEEVRNMVTNLVAQYDLHRSAAKLAKA